MENFIVKTALLLKRYYFLGGLSISKIEWDNIFTIILFSGRRQNIHKSSFWVRLYMYILRQWRKLINSFSLAVIYVYIQSMARIRIRVGL